MERTWRTMSLAVAVTFEASEEVRMKKGPAVEADPF